MSLLLTLTQNLYREFRRERSGTDAAVLQLREFLTNQFGHEGTRAYQEVDESTSTKQIENPAARHLKRFVHPLAAAKPRVAVVQSTPLLVNLGAGVRTKEGTVGTLPAVGAGGADDLGKPLILPESQPSKLGSPAVPVAGNFEPIEPIELVELSELKPKTAGAKYERNRLIETLRHYGVSFHENGSNTQLAAALIQYAIEKTAR